KTLRSNYKILLIYRKKRHNKKGWIRMADNKKKNLPPEAQKYQAFQKERETKRPLFKNCLKAFFVGGFICFIGQVISTFIYTFLISRKKQRATLPLLHLFLSRCY